MQISLMIGEVESMSPTDVGNLMRTIRSIGGLVCIYTVNSSLRSILIRRLEFWSTALDVDKTNDKSEIAFRDMVERVQERRETRRNRTISEIARTSPLNSSLSCRLRRSRKIHVR